MKVGVIQSSYLPWRGYFDFIHEVDLFVVYDEVQFSKGSWRNRNRLKTARGLEWMTVPVRHESLAQRICDTKIDGRQDWQRRHRALIERSFSAAPHLDDVLTLVEPHFSQRYETISELNIGLLASICSYLDIRTPVRLSSEFELSGASTERLVALLGAVGASTYLSGPTARAYLDEQRFRDANIRLEYKQYDYLPYPQGWGSFEGAVSILDTIANCGRRTRDVLSSRGRNERAA